MDYVTEITDIKKENFTIPTGQNIYKYILEFGNISYQVGARDFLEYIAQKIESKYWDTHSPDLPYITLDKIFEYYDLSFIPTEVRMCIVEYCLYNDNPIHMLISQFIKSNCIRENLDVFMNYSLCSEYLLNLGWISYGGFQETIFSKTQRRLRDLKKQLIAQYEHPLLNSVVLWISSVIDYCKDNLSNKFILSELYTLDIIDFSKRLNGIIDAIGIPIIENASHTFMNILPEQFEVDQFIQFYVLHKFMGYIQSADSCCPIIEFCKANFRCEIDRSTCLNNPTSGLDELECPFKLFINLYGFADVEFL